MASINLISLANVKAQLGITNSTNDSAISAMIPLVSSDIRRILGTNFDEYASCQVTVGSATISISEGFNTQGFLSRFGNVPIGTVIQCAGFPADTYISDYDNESGTYTASNACTALATSLTPTINIGMWNTIAKMIWYKISKQTTVGIDKERGISSESYGPISVSYSDKEINNKWMYPSSLISDLGSPYASVG
jgi:hypothetical protein